MDCSINVHSFFMHCDTVKLHKSVTHCSLERINLWTKHSMGHHQLLLVTIISTASSSLCRDFFDAKYKNLFTSSVIQYWLFASLRRVEGEASDWFSIDLEPKQISARKFIRTEPQNSKFWTTRACDSFELLENSLVNCSSI